MHIPANRDINVGEIPPVSELTRWQWTEIYSQLRKFFAHQNDLFDKTLPYMLRQSII